ncbi:MAG: hypothetical protein U1F60_10530 [Planctomycetota bacterium]
MFPCRLVAVCGSLAVAFLGPSLLEPAQVAALQEPALQEPTVQEPTVQDPTQQVDANVERRASTLVVSSPEEGLRAAVAVGYTPAVWRDHYDAQVDHLEGVYMRLGTGWWTTFDTASAIDLAGVRIAPGSYFLGLRCGPGTAFSLLLFDSTKAMQAHLLPATTALYRGDARPDFEVPMTFARGSLATSAARLAIDLTGSAKDRTSARLSIRWGKHELSAPLTLQLLDVVDTTGK